MHQENLWATSARPVGFTLTYDLDHTSDSGDGTLRFTVKWSKQTSGMGTTVVHLDMDTEEFISSILHEMYLGYRCGAPASAIQRKANNALRDAHRQLEAITKLHSA